MANRDGCHQGRPREEGGLEGGPRTELLPGPNGSRREKSRGVQRRAEAPFDKILPESRSLRERAKGTMAER